AHGDGWPGPRVAREPSAMALAAARAARQATNAVSGAGDAVSSAAAGAAGADSAAGGGPAATGRGGRMRNFAKANAEADADSEDAGDGGPRQNAEGGAEDAETRSKVQVWEWVDDLMEGFAELYKLTITGGHTCAEGIRRGAYPIKESCVESWDTIQRTFNPPSDSRRHGAAPTFRHE
ncbi:unnamed protein product, partial [Prorocentrum cordatum]